MKTGNETIAALMALASAEKLELCFESADGFQYVRLDSLGDTIKIVPEFERIAIAVAKVTGRDFYLTHVVGSVIGLLDANLSPWVSNAPTGLYCEIPEHYLEEDISQYGAKYSPSSVYSSIKLPKHVSLTLTHNPGSANLHTYKTVEQWMESQQQLGMLDSFYFVLGAQDMAKCCNTESLWILDWNPETPSGSRTIAGSSLEALLAYIDKENSDG